MTEKFLHDLFRPFSKVHYYFAQDFESDQSLVALEKSPFFTVLEAIDRQVYPHQYPEDQKNFCSSVNREFWFL